MRHPVEGDRSPYRSLTAASVQEEVEASLRRLKVEAIDLYQIHWPDPEEEIEEAWAAMARFREQGKVRWIGVSNFNVGQMERIQKIAPITSLQPPYSMLRPAIEAEILPFTQKNGIGVINYSPMVSGLLTGKMSAERVKAMPADDWRRKAVEFNEPRLSRNLALVERLREIGNAHDVSPGVVAVAWTLHQPRNQRGDRGRAQRQAGGGAFEGSALQADRGRVRAHRWFSSPDERGARCRRCAAANKKARPWPGFLVRRSHCLYIAATKSGTRNGGMLLEQLSHSRGHSRVHRCGSEGV